jgi:hypothetical protein
MYALNNGIGQVALVIQGSNIDVILGLFVLSYNPVRLYNLNGIIQII